MYVEWAAYRELLDRMSQEIGDLSGLSAYANLAERFEGSSALADLREADHGLRDLERDLSDSFGADQSTWLARLRVVMSAAPAAQVPGYGAEWEGYFLRWDDAGFVTCAPDKYAADDAWLPPSSGDENAEQEATAEADGAQWPDATDLPGSVVDLAWVTPPQQEQFAALAQARGDWRGWLPGQLDTMWGEWRTATPDVLAGWLDQWMPTLVPASPVPGRGAAAAEPDAPELDAAEIRQLTQSVIAPVLGEVQAELGALADQLQVPAEQLAAELSALIDQHPDRIAAAILDGIRNAG
jgi:hypothetical protein